jgi:hypothetical protein
MLDNPPKTKFNVTQTFALFTAILLWTKNRIYVGGDRPEYGLFKDADHAARDVKNALAIQDIFDAPWFLSKAPPRLAAERGKGGFSVADATINTDFVGVTAQEFVEWLRNAIAHGDGRAIRPIHKLSRTGNKALLAGFEIAFPVKRGSRRILKLSLYHDDMTRIGSILADTFCRALSGGNRYFERDAGTTAIREAAWASSRIQAS